MKAAVRYLAVLILSLAVLAVPAKSIGFDEDFDQPIASKIQSKIGMRLDERYNRMAEMLSLSTGQQVLLEKMKTAAKSYLLLQMESKRNMRRVFRDEFGKERPDFKRAGEIIKSEHNQQSNQAFNAMIDANVEFYQSLTPAQQQKLVEFDRERKERLKQRFSGRHNESF